MVSLITNSRDINRKFLFGHFMMRPKYAPTGDIPVWQILHGNMWHTGTSESAIYAYMKEYVSTTYNTKKRTSEDYIINPFRAAWWEEVSGVSAKDFDLGGDVFVISENKDCNVLGFAIDAEGDLYDIETAERARNALDTLNREMNRKMKLIVVPKAGILLGNKDHWPTGEAKITDDPDEGIKLKHTLSKYEEYFDAALIWSYGSYGWNSSQGEHGDAYEAYIGSWRNNGFTKQIGIIQDTYRDSGGYVGKSAYKDCIDFAQTKKIPFCVFQPRHSDEDDPSVLPWIKKNYEEKFPKYSLKK